MLYFAFFIIIIKSLKSRLVKLPFKFIKVYINLLKKGKKVIAILRLSFKVLGIKKKK
jgi:hypothetical protein